MEIKLTKREKQIVHELAKANHPSTSKFLGEVCSVSERTIKNDIKNLSLVMNDYGAQIISIKGKGYLLKIIQEEKFDQLISSVQICHENFLNFSTLDERIHSTIKYLLDTCDSYVLLDDLCEKMFVSKTTMNSDIKEIKLLLKKDGIALISKPNIGIKIIGAEQKIRSAIIKYSKINYLTIDAYNKFINQKNLRIDLPQEIADLVITSLEELNYPILGIELSNLIVHIIIALNRIQSGYEILEDYLKDELVLTNEFILANKIAQSIEEILHIHLPINEVKYLSFCLIGKSNSNVTQQNDDVTLFIKNVYEKINEIYNITIDIDSEITKGLYLHVKALLQRIKYGIQIKNSIIDVIRKKYVLAYEMAVIFNMEFIKKYGESLDDVEMCYIAVHFGAALESNKMNKEAKKVIIVCDSRAGSALLLKNKIMAVFKNKIMIDGVFSIYELRKLNVEHYDFIITTLPLEAEYNHMAIQVPIILDDQSIMRIDKCINRKNQIMSVFKKDIFYKNHSSLNCHSLLKSVASDFESFGYINDSELFVEKVIQREKLQSTRYDYVFALPHPIEIMAKENFISVIALDQGIKWFDGEVVKLIFVLGFSGSKEDCVNEIYEIIGNITSNRYFVDILVNCQNYGDFINKIKGENLC